MMEAAEGVFEVEEIVDRRLDEQGGHHIYRVRWKGCPPEEDTWEPKQHLYSCEDLLIKFKEKQRLKRELKAKQKKNMTRDFDGIVIKQEPPDDGDSTTRLSSENCSMLPDILIKKENHENKSDEDENTHNTSVDSTQEADILDLVGFTRHQRQAIARTIEESKLASPLSSPTTSKQSSDFPKTTNGKRKSSKSAKMQEKSPEITEPAGKKSLQDSATGITPVSQLQSPTVKPSTTPLNSSKSLINMKNLSALKSKITASTMSNVANLSVESKSNQVAKKALTQNSIAKAVLNLKGIIKSKDVISSSQNTNSTNDSSMESTKNVLLSVLSGIQLDSSKTNVGTRVSKTTLNKPEVTKKSSNFPSTTDKTIESAANCSNAGIKIAEKAKKNTSPQTVKDMKSMEVVKPKESTNSQNSTSESSKLSLCERETFSKLDVKCNHVQELTKSKASTKESSKKLQLSGIKNQKESNNKRTSIQSLALQEGASGDKDRGKKLSYKEYKAKNRKKRSDSQPVESGLFLDFMKIPSKPKNFAPRKVGSIDKETIVKPVKVAPALTEKPNEHGPKTQDLPSVDVLGTLLDRIEPPVKKRSEEKLEEEQAMQAECLTSNRPTVDGTDDCDIDFDLDDYSGDEDGLLMASDVSAMKNFHLLLPTANSRTLDHLIIHQAIVAGDTKAVIECNIADINKHVDDMDTLLMKAVMECAQDMVKILLEKNADPNVASKNFKTPLMVAVELKQRSLVSLLIQCGARMNIQTPSGETALIMACKLGFIEIVHVLLNSGADFRPAVTCLEKMVAVPKHLRPTLHCSLQIHSEKLRLLTEKVLNDVMRTDLLPVSLDKQLMGCRCICTNESNEHDFYFNSDVYVCEPQIQVILLALSVNFERNGSISPCFDPSLKNGIEDVLLNNNRMIQILPQNRYLYFLYPTFNEVNKLRIETDVTSENKILVCVYAIKYEEAPTPSPSVTHDPLQPPPIPPPLPLPMSC